VETFKRIEEAQVHELALFAGVGGGILGGKLLGWRTVCAVEREEYAASVLAQRQNDGHLEPFPIWSDVRTFDGKPWRGRVDVVSGGFPCQDISSAGRGAGIEGSRSGLWVEMARIIGEVLPRFVFVENSPMLTSRGLGVVLGDLAAMGYHARWGVLGAHHAGAPHKRDRIWILASYPDSDSEPVKPVYDEAPRVPKLDPDSDSGSSNRRADLKGRREKERATLGRVGGKISNTNSGRHRPQKEEIRTRGNGSFHVSWWSVEPGVGRVAHGVARRVDRLRAIGNGQVPAVAALAWRVLGGPSV
jgi:DNA (cytosine-5)-methyltransferase 1